MAYRTLAPASSSRSAGRLLAAACIAATLGLTACDAAVETAREAQRHADQAARIAASAGQPRATDKLLERVAETPLADRNDLEKQLGTAGDMIRQESAEKDLTAASDLINQALKSELAPGIKAALQSEAGGITLQLAAQRYNNLQPRLHEIVTRAMQLQSMAQLAINLGGEATAISATVKAPTSEDVDKAKAAVGTAQQNVTRAQAEVERLTKEIAAKQEQAREIYSRTQAAFQAADALKGKEAIDAGNKAIEESKQGDARMAEAGNLEPQLAAARTALSIAQVHQKDAERQLATATTAFEQGNAWVKQNTERTNTLQSQAKEVVSGPKGVAEQYAQLVKLVTDLNADIEAAAQTAEQAGTQYAAASSGHNSTMSALSAKLQEALAPSDDPLMKLSRDARAAALLSWGQAAAAEQAGRIHAAGYHAASLAGMMKGLVDNAHKAAGMTAPQAALPDKAGHQTRAAEAFKNAIESAKAGTDRSSPELDRIKWVGFSLQALGNQGLALISTDRATVTQHNNAAKEAAAAATRTEGAEAHGNPDVAVQLRRAGIDVAG